MDPNQRSFYDQHGFAADALRKQGLPSIFDYTPKYGIYEERIHADGETTELEDWFAAQGHSVRDQNITIRQRIKKCIHRVKMGICISQFSLEIKRILFNYPR